MHIRTTRKNTSSTVVIICVKKYHKSEISLLVMCIDLYASSLQIWGLQAVSLLRYSYFFTWNGKRDAYPTQQTFLHAISLYVACILAHGPVAL